MQQGSNVCSTLSVHDATDATPERHLWWMHAHWPGFTAAIRVQLTSSWARRDDHHNGRWGEGRKICTKATVGNLKAVKKRARRHARELELLDNVGHFLEPVPIDVGTPGAGRHDEKRRALEQYHFARVASVSQLLERCTQALRIGHKRHDNGGPSLQLTHTTQDNSATPDDTWQAGISHH